MSVILIIDDDEKFRNMLRQMLERAGYKVDEAADGNEGLRLIKEKQIDLAVVDIIMPEKEGLETIKELRQNFPNLKIIAISGGGRGKPETYLKPAKLIGAHYTFAKPIDKEEMLGAVKELILGVWLKTDNYINVACQKTVAFTYSINKLCTLAGSDHPMRIVSFCKR